MKVKIITGVAAVILGLATTAALAQTQSPIGQYDAGSASAPKGPIGQYDMGGATAKKSTE